MCVSLLVVPGYELTVHHHFTHLLLKLGAFSSQRMLLLASRDGTTSAAARWSNNTRLRKTLLTSQL